MTREIPLTRGYVAIVDDEDYERVAAEGKWCVTMNGGRSVYAVRFRRDPASRRKTRTLLHRFLMAPPPGLYVDHINSDGLDCRRSNMRICTRSQNCRNARKSLTRESSLFKGVSWNQKDSRWASRIWCNGRSFWVGNFFGEIDAARAYDAAAIIHFGEFARLNFRPGESHIIKGD